MATGQRVALWAKKHGVPLRTCYNLTKTQEYKVTVREVRRRAMDRAVGHFARSLTKAADRIALLATEADSQSVQLQAARTVLRESLKIREHVDLEEQMDELERKLDEREGKVT